MLNFCYWILYFAAIANFVSRCHAVLEECPHPEDNYPCYCEEDNGPTEMHCNYLNESSQIKQALHKLSDYKILKLNFFKNEIQNIKSGVFLGPSVYHIMFMNSTVNLESPVFTGLESSLTRLTFLACFDTDKLMQSWSLAHLASLRDMTFDRNVIKILNNDWLSSVGPNLRSVTFSECHIEKLEEKVFAKMESLATLFLNDNAISSISRSMFPKPAENLRSINLNQNKLQNLPDDIFEAMPSLKSIDLEKNQLKSLGESTWSALFESLSRLSLDDNPIHCDRSLKWISKKFLPKSFSGKCSEPARLKNKSLRVLTPADFH